MFLCPPYTLFTLIARLSHLNSLAGFFSVSLMNFQMHSGRARGLEVVWEVLRLYQAFALPLMKSSATGNLQRSPAEPAMDYRVYVSCNPEEVLIFPIRWCYFLL